MARVFVAYEDFRKASRSRVPKFAFDYVDGGADSEHTLRANSEAFNMVSFRPRQALGTTKINLKTTVLGTELTLPVMLAPVGMVNVMGPGGDIAGVRAASAQGTGFVLSTMSGHSLEEVAAESSGDIWYQVYSVGGRAPVELAIERVKKAHYQALMITVDTQELSARERDSRNHLDDLLSGSLLRVLPYSGQAIRHPIWLARRVMDGLYPRLKNVQTADGGFVIRGRGISPESLTWEDFAWVREAWNGPIVVKGILTADDARRACDVGASAVVVSNHGGRQLDFAEATLRVLPEIVSAVGDRCEVLLDGGVRRGTDVMKALCLGAKAVLIGRPWAFGLGANGQSGVKKVLELFEADIILNMKLLGCHSVQDLGPEFVRIPRDWTE